MANANMAKTVDFHMKIQMNYKHIKHYYIQTIAIKLKLNLLLTIMKMKVIVKMTLVFIIILIHIIHMITNGVQSDQMRIGNVIIIIILGIITIIIIVNKTEKTVIIEAASITN